MSAHLTPEREAEIRARLEAASNDAWHPFTENYAGHGEQERMAEDVAFMLRQGDMWMSGVLLGRTQEEAATAGRAVPHGTPVPGNVTVCLTGNGPNARANAALIANAPADLTALLRELDLLRADATAALDAAARGEGVERLLTRLRGEQSYLRAIGHSTVDLGVDELRAAIARECADAERERDLLAATARLLTGERDAARKRVAEVVKEMNEARWAWGCGPSANIAATGTAVMAEARDNLDALKYLEEISTTRDGFWLVPPVLSLPVRRYGSAFIGSVLASAAAQDAIDEATNAE